MNTVRRKFLHLAAGAAALPAVSRSAEAQAYPTRPITIVVPLAAGGALDMLARFTAERMRTRLGFSTPRPRGAEISGRRAAVKLSRALHRLRYEAEPPKRRLERELDKQRNTGTP